MFHLNEFIGLADGLADFVTDMEACAKAATATQFDPVEIHSWDDDLPISVKLLYGKDVSSVQIKHGFESKDPPHLSRDDLPRLIIALMAAQRAIRILDLAAESPDTWSEFFKIENELKNLKARLDAIGNKERPKPDGNLVGVH